MRKIDKAKVYNAEEGIQLLEKYIKDRFNKSYNDIRADGTPAERAGLFLLLALEAPFYGVCSETFIGSPLLLGLVTKTDLEDWELEGWLSEDVKDMLLEALVCREALFPPQRIRKEAIRLGVLKASSALCHYHSEVDLLNIMNKVASRLQPEGAILLSEAVTEVAGGRLSINAQSEGASFELSRLEVLKQALATSLEDLNKIAYDIKVRITALQGYMKDYKLPNYLLGVLEQDLIRRAVSNNLFSDFLKEIFYYMETGTEKQNWKTLPLEILSAFPVWENIKVDQQDVQKQRKRIVEKCYAKVLENFNYILRSTGITADGQKEPEPYYYVRNIYNSELNYNLG